MLFGGLCWYNLAIRYLIPYTEVCKWNETAFFLWGATSIFFVLWREECVSLVDEIGFEELILNMKISTLNCQTKNWPMCLSKESCIWRPNMGRLPHPGVKIECSFRIKIKAKGCPFNKSFRVWWNVIWTFLPCQIADRSEMTSDTCHCCMWSPFSTSRQGLLSFSWRVLCKYSVRSMSFHILLSPFFSFHIMFRTTSCHLMSFHIILYHFMSFHIILYHFMSFHIILYHFMSLHVISCHFMSFHIISFLSASLHPVWWNHEKRYCLIFVRLTTSQLYHLHPYAFETVLVDYIVGTFQ